MKSRKPKLILEPETSRIEPPFPVRAKPPMVIQAESAKCHPVICLPATAEELVVTRKPYLPANPDEVKPKLPFSVTNEPLPPPQKDPYPAPSFPKSVPESEYLNTDKLMTEEEKNRYIFLTNHTATYGNVTEAEANAAYSEFRERQITAKLLAKNPELRMKIAQKASELPNWVHLILISASLWLFIVLRGKSIY